MWTVEPDGAGTEQCAIIIAGASLLRALRLTLLKNLGSREHSWQNTTLASKLGLMLCSV